MSDQPTTQPSTDNPDTGTQTGQGQNVQQQPQNAEQRRIAEEQETFRSQTLSPDEKHQAYIETVEKIRSEP
jgi:hypothetical protein